MFIVLQVQGTRIQKKNLYAPCLSYDLLQKCMELHFWNHRHIILIVGKDKRKKNVLWQNCYITSKYYRISKKFEENIFRTCITKG